MQRNFHVQIKTMQLIKDVSGLHTRLAGVRKIAFVPTMGNLHAGHLDLVRRAREQTDCVVVSIFVNPLQFGPNEDFDKYPRTLEADCASLQELADVVFAPSVSEMYPAKQTVFVELPPVANDLDGVTRPGHFRGMATVVLKLLNIVQPQVALFGKKDYQQLFIIRQMVAQLNLQVEIVGSETVRAPDGLALSSRNQYLSPVERTEAAFLYRTLVRMRQELLDGAKDYAKLELEAADSLAARGWQVEYIAVRSQSSLARPEGNEGNLVILAAVRLGGTRLIDNLEVCLKK